LPAASGEKFIGCFIKKGTWNVIKKQLFTFDEVKK
jgi:hypothetical protein